jgi:hypothetical protein
LDKVRLHIVSFDVPYPANYGGVIDVFYRIKSLYELGVEVYLHCFEYGRGEAIELNKYCKKVHYYKREKSITDLFSKLPFIVKSRINSELINRLNEDDYPILFEGLHTTGVIGKLINKKRITFVRTHNIEHQYYDALSKKSNGLKKVFFQLEAKKLKRFETQLQASTSLLCITDSDLEYFKKINKDAFLLQPSFAERKYENKELVQYALFQGNLGVEENDEAACWIIEKVWSDQLKYPLIIAGKNPSVKLKEVSRKYSIQLIDSPDLIQMDNLIENASVHVLYSTQSTGIKLKLLAALQTNGIVLSNQHLVSGSGLEEYCVIANDSNAFKQVILNLNNYYLSDEDKMNRRILFQTKLNVNLNNQLILELIQKHQ